MAKAAKSIDPKGMSRLLFIVCLCGLTKICQMAASTECNARQWTSTEISAWRRREELDECIRHVCQQRFSLRIESNLMVSRAYITNGESGISAKVLQELDKLVDMYPNNDRTNAQTYMKVAKLGGAHFFFLYRQRFTFPSLHRPPIHGPPAANCNRESETLMCRDEVNLGNR